MKPAAEAILDGGAFAAFKRGSNTIAPATVLDMVKAEAWIASEGATQVS
jgi:hypothetical protein